MKNKVCAVALLIAGLVMTGCGPSQPASSFDPDNFTVSGNGESWPEEISALLARVLGDIEVPYVDAKEYQGEYDASGSADIASVLCLNDTTFERTAITTFTTDLTALDFEIDSSDALTTGVTYGILEIGPKHYACIGYGLAFIEEKSTEEADFYGFRLYCYTVLDTSLTVGELDAWPTEAIEKVVGVDIPHPVFADPDSVEMMGNDNLLELTSGGYLYAYVMFFPGSTVEDCASYYELLEARYWDVETEVSGSTTYYVAFNMLTQVVMEWWYVVNPKLGSGMQLFIYQNNPDAIFERSTSWPTADLTAIGLGDMPAYVEAGQEIAYWSVAVNSNGSDFVLIVVEGVTENAVDVYTALVEAAGWTVEDQELSDGTPVKFATKGQYAFWYMLDTYPEIGTALYIEC